MIKGIGVDLIELDRVAEQIHHAAFVKRILTAAEQKTYATLNDRRKIEFLAGHFSAKEAYAKAKGTGIGGSVSFQDLTVSYNASGQPALKDRLHSADVIHLSITHTKHAAAAFVVIESLSC
ncbi:holo-ACP synthase [Sporolactobacillus sp. CPB3-1]|uniref:Holo-[acyl-carrier-protein] synthase n=1 Tax=Sporolactobacillus mangiferae TaxID=2940498 RepID=A0ABT0MBU8_9BACL|nr:holo-ACP synthase [Sporolactobacillus mangiferae]MCL1632349.1 holo-ACP synthase [Sporolactobacillus mangiferae]